jgi:glycosyltransferase involved in cell wall biosynthesis
VTIPWTVRAPVRRGRNALALGRLVARQLPRWRAIAAAAPRRDRLAVSYGIERMPSLDDVAYGGAVKFQLLAAEMPNSPRDFNLLYLGSTTMPLEARLLVRLARRRGAAFVWNQNGVAYPGWHGPGWELLNAPRARMLHEADHVVFQSAFCKVGADRYYGERAGPSEVLHNPVDTHRFTPAASRPRRPQTLLLGGNQYQRYRLEVALETLALLREDDDVRLIVTGFMSYDPEALLAERRIEEHVHFIGAYTQRDAPELMRRADILLHTKYNDPCPTLVLEAMASGLPVVYSASGGTPELVGPQAGVGVPAPLDWERDHPPDPQELATAVRDVTSRLDELRLAARARAEQFDARRWIARHRELFEELALR